MAALASSCWDEWPDLGKPRQPEGSQLAVKRPQHGWRWQPFGHVELLTEMRVLHRQHY